MMSNDPFKKVDKFGIQLLVAFVLSIGLILFSNIAFGEPQWVQKPIQCATPPEVLDRLDKDKLLPLFAAVGNARVENEMHTKPYGFFYNEDTKYWAFVEFFDYETMCIVAIGEGVDFDVQD
ncbi:hypothetical protein OAA08_00580 [bacterium]|nr:hypothetical protein [bacterium]